MNKENRKNVLAISTKRTISLLLAVLTLLSILPVYSLAATEKKIKAIEFLFEEPDSNTFTIGLSDGYTVKTSDKTSEYYYFKKYDFNQKDTLKIIYTDGKAKYYEYEMSKGAFICGKDVIKEDNVKIDNNQEKHHWTPKGKYNYYYIKYKDFKYKVPVTIKSNPFKSISAKLKYPIYAGVDNYCISDDIPKKYIIYTVVTASGKVFKGTGEEFYKKYYKYDTSLQPVGTILSETVGKHSFPIRLGGMRGKCYYEIKKQTISEKSPSVTCNKHIFYVNYGDRIDCQLLNFNSGNHKPIIETPIRDLPYGLEITKDGRLRGSLWYTPQGYDCLVDVRWTGSTAHTEIWLRFNGKPEGAKKTIPSKCTSIKYLKWYDISNKSGGSSWYKFKAIDNELVIEGITSKLNRTLVDSKGNVLSPLSDPHDWIVGQENNPTAEYHVERGKTYYIIAKSKSDKVMITPNGSNREYNVDGNPVETGKALLKKVGETTKTINGKTVKLNKYSAKLTFNKYVLPDSNKTFKYTMGYDMFSPVRIYTDTNLSSNLKNVICGRSSVTDVNDWESQRKTGVYVNNNKDEMRKGEKEYRVNYFAEFPLEKTSLFKGTCTTNVYVPIGYYIPEGSVHVEKHEAHVVYVTIGGKKQRADCSTPEKYFKNCICEVCGEKVTKIDHTRSGRTLTRKAGYEKDGIYTYKCEFCGIVTKKEIIPAVCFVYQEDDKTYYSGLSKKPYVLLYDKDNNMISTSYYTVSYSDNINRGKATITISLKGKYSGTITRNFTIV